MEFSPHNDKIMHPFLESFGKCPPPALDKSSEKIVNSILISLYQEIKGAKETVLKEGCFQSRLINDKTEFKRPVLNTIRYYPASIKKYIQDNEQSQTIYHCKNVGGREINIHFTNFQKQAAAAAAGQAAAAEQVAYVRQMYAWLLVCSKYASATCAKTLDVYIYPTPFIKQLPANSGAVLSAEHVNTAFTTACAPESQLIIFREEEWFKVFIHETFHSYGLDFAMNNGMPEYVASIFPIQSDFDIYEAYTETWARIVNCAFGSLTKQASLNEFLENISFCLEMERMFAIYQCSKILGYMGLQYNNLHETGVTHVNLRQNLYKENTHVFAYYVMTAIFLNNYQGFMIWCNTYNDKLFKFKDTPENFKAFDAYIKQNYNCPSLQDGIDYMVKLNRQMVPSHVKPGNKKYKELLNTTRMSIIHALL